MQPTQSPSLGRIVHFTCDTHVAGKLNQLHGKRYNVGDKVAGMITCLGDNDAAYLTIFPVAEEQLAIGQVPFSSGNQPGTWNWPERTGQSEGKAAEAA